MQRKTHPWAIGAHIAIVMLLGGGSAEGQTNRRPMATAEPRCSLAWKARGIASQNEAQRFASTCLSAADGAVDATLSSAAVRTKLEALIPPGHPLTAIKPTDVSVFCPGYAAASRDDRARFWRELLTAIARPESNYRTKTAYWEGGQDQYSLGLLQLSYNDRNSYRDASLPGCDFETEAEVTNPDVNLRCGVKILTKLVRRAQAIGGDQPHRQGGGAAYWSTLRMTSNARQPIIGATRAIPACRQN